MVVDGVNNNNDDAGDRNEDNQQLNPQIMMPAHQQNLSQALTPSDHVLSCQPSSLFPNHHQVHTSTQSSQLQLPAPAWTCHPTQLPAPLAASPPHPHAPVQSCLSQLQPAQPRLTSQAPQLYASVQDMPADNLVSQQPPPSLTHSNSGSGALETNRCDDHQSHCPGEERVGVDYDILEHHHARNCQCYSPSPTFLNTIGMQKSKKQCTNTEEELSLKEDNNEVVSTVPGLSGQGHCAKYLKNPKGSQPAKSLMAGFFPPLWNKLFDLAKA
ncbi:hypothetical protein BKA83DRAFT_4487053 [Pisolithus microcarpus]|nr:hypothetical protein BKA83DRAFT_4487053 [Pisolithus microcarpus]